MREGGSGGGRGRRNEKEGKEGGMAGRRGIGGDDYSPIERPSFFVSSLRGLSFSVDNG